MKAVWEVVKRERRTREGCLRGASIVMNDSVFLLLCFFEFLSLFESRGPVLWE